MCGIFGYISNKLISQDRWSGARKSQMHRGPDSYGEWHGATPLWHIGIAHQRLSIIDLSPSGHQPMVSNRTRSVLSFNGEVYNYLELKKELTQKGHQFEGSSDSEVLLHALDHWGPDEANRLIDGMWAYALFNPDNEHLTLSRDRYGEKPLYWTFSKKSLFFASELKCLLELTGEKFHLNPTPIMRYLHQSLIDSSSDTFFEGIYQLAPSHSLTVKLSTDVLAPQIHPYTSIGSEVFDASQTDDQVFDHLEDIFTRSVERRLRSDVPVGILLSGGLDSSAIASIAIRTAKSDATLLSAVSTDSRFDESTFINRMGRFLDRKVHSIQLSDEPSELFSELEEATWFADHPISNLSNLAHRKLMKRAKELGLTVVLSGQGADELLCGYKKYLGFYIQTLFRKGRFQKAMVVLAQFYKNNSILNQFNLAEAKRYIPGTRSKSDAPHLGPKLADETAISLGIGRGQSLRERQIDDVRFYSVPNLNHYEDRMSMSYSREIRLPFLEPTFVEYCLSLPPRLKLDKGWTKYAFRRAMEKHLPTEITWRKDKQGFVNPQSEWIKDQLKNVILTKYLTPDSLIFRFQLLRRQGLLNLYSSYCTQKPNSGRIWFREVFNPIALEIWLRKFEQFIQY